MVKAFLMALLCLPFLVFAEAGRPVVEIFMPKPCLACIDWGAYLADRGFKVVYKASDDMAAVKRRLKVPPEVESVHTATVGGYFVEGHAHAEDIQELLRDRPKARGIAVPGLPRGAPGRETSNPSCETGCTMLDSDSGEKNPRRELYDTLLVLPDGSTKIWARH
jgi:hypothetical protein